MLYNATVDQLKNINFDPKLQTIVAIHGFTDFYDQFNWMGDMRDEILRKKSCKHNVILVDWSGGSKVSIYLQAVANTRIVGAIVATFLNRLHKAQGTNNNNIVVVGHSLGGQIAGFVGERMNKPKIRLIIGLDPAGPAYYNVSLGARLDPSDAQLVISLQTNGGENVADGLGLSYPVGHYSFFPNGGEQQKGCDSAHGVLRVLVAGLAEGITDAIACSHRRACPLLSYDETLFDDFESMAYACSNYSDYSAGKCTKCRDGSDDCKPFGDWFDYWPKQKVSTSWKAPISYYIDTREKLPYSYYFYGIKVMI